MIGSNSTNLLLYLNNYKRERMKKILYYFMAGSLLLSLMNACSNSDDELEPDYEQVPDEEQNPDEGESTTIDEETLATNKWIKENMEEVYYWNDQFPDIDYTQQSDPEEYFYDLLYDDDEFSWITDDYASLKSEYDGDPVAMGYDPSFYTFSNASDQVFIVVNYVYPGSGAETAGLRRGNIILEIDGEEITTDNYYDLYSGSAYSVSLGQITVENNTYYIGESGTTLNLTSSIPDTEPIIHHEVIDTQGHKIGYLAYAEFLEGKDDKFLSSMDEVFGEFKSAGISDLIVDLRYNPGGDISAAAHLASEIAPAGVVSGEETLVNLKYNDTYQAYLEQHYPEELYYTFDKSVSTNLNLSKVYFLTTGGTASASELTITGLDPYMDVVQVGEATYGKFYGAYVLPDDDEKWAMLPIVMKYSNADGYSDFTDGLTPDYEGSDDLVVDDADYNDQLIYLYPLGNPADAMTKTAIEVILGTYSTMVATRAASAPVAKFRSFLPEGTELSRKRNLLVPAPAEMRNSPGEK